MVPLAAFDLRVVDQHMGALMHGLALTVETAALGFAIAVGLGLPLALGKVSRSPLLRLPSSGLVTLARGVPLLIVIFWLYYAVAEKGLFTLTGFLAAVLSLGLTGAGYMAEIYRTAFLAVPAGQREAATAIGLSRGQAFARVVGPQALRTALPPAMNLFVALLKGATLISVIGVADMFYVARVVAADQFKPFELYTVAALLIIAVTLIAALVSGAAERYISRGQR